MNRKRIFYIVFFSVLVVGFYLVMNYLIPGFSKKRLAPISTVQSFNFQNQDGKQVTQEDVQGKVYVAEYFFTTCTGICPIMNGNMKKVYATYRDRDDFLILSHTSDPETDSVQQLKAYADSLGVDTRKWIFLTGRKDSLYNTARFSYKLDDPANNLGSIKDQFIHTQFFALVDRKGVVRKIYDGIRTAEVDQMITDIARLLKEKPVKKPA